MANLTTARSIVQPVPDTNPVPGYQLVVFTRYGEGREFRATLAPGQRFVPTVWERLFSRGNGYTAFAVSCDRHLRERFTRTVKKAGELGPLTLHLNLQFCVSDAQLAVEAQESDPLQRLVDEIGDLMEPATLRFDWPLLGGPDDVLDQDLQKAFLHGARELKTLASALGFEICGLQVGHALSPELDEHLRAQRAADHTKVIHEAEHGVRVEQIDRDEKLRVREARVKAALAGIEAVGDLSTGAIDSLQTVLRQIAAGVNTPSALNAVLGELGETLQKIRTAALGAAGAEAGTLLSVSSVSPVQLAAGSQSQRSPLEIQVSKALDILGPINSDLSLRTRLFSRILCLFGELAAGNESAARRHAEALGERAFWDELMDAVGKYQQRAYLEALQDLPKLRAELQEVGA